MKKDWGCKTNRIDPIQNSRMALYQRTIVLNSPIPFDRRHRHAARRSHNADHKRHRTGSKPSERCDLQEKLDRHSAQGGAECRANEAFPSPRGIYCFCNYMPANTSIPDKMGGIANLHHHQKEQQQPGRVAIPFHLLMDCRIVSHQLEIQKGRRVTKGIDTDQKPKLDFGNPLQKTFMVTGECDTSRNE